MIQTGEPPGKWAVVNYKILYIGGTQFEKDCLFITIETLT
jgi:hypothetical protein